MLKDSLYTITHHTAGESPLYSVSLCADHVIYRAHFPQMPITPGVCIVQMVKELAEDAMGCVMEVASVSNIKFLTPLSPSEGQEVKVSFGTLTREEDVVHVQAVVTCNDTAIAKLKFDCNLL